MKTLLLKKQLIKIFKKLILDKQIMYDHSVDKSQDRFKNKKQLDTFEKNLLPSFILENFNDLFF